MKIVRGKILSSLGVSNKKILATNYFKVKLFVPLLTNLMLYITMHGLKVNAAQAQAHNDNQV